MTEVSRAERVLYGGAAGMIRKLGLAVSNAEEALEACSRALQASREADDAIAPGPGSHEGQRRDFDEQGRSPNTVWLDGLFERLYGLRKSAGELFSQVAAECIATETGMRKHIDSIPAGEPDGPGV